MIYPSVYDAVTVAYQLSGSSAEAFTFCWSLCRYSEEFQPVL